MPKATHWEIRAEPGCKLKPEGQQESKPIMMIPETLREWEGRGARKYQGPPQLGVNAEKNYCRPAQQPLAKLSVAGAWGGKD